MRISYRRNRGICWVHTYVATCCMVSLRAIFSRLLTTRFIDVIMTCAEPSLASTGGPVPAGLQAIKATREPRMSLDDLNRAFSLSVSAYYPPFTFPQSIDPLSSYHPPRLALLEELDHVDHRLTPTTSRMTPAELRETVLVEVIDTYGSQNLLRKLNPAIYEANVERALFDRRFAIGDALEEVWPALRVHVVWCDMSVGDCVWASVLLHHRHAAADPEWRRPMTVHKLAGANHFVSAARRTLRWDEVTHVHRYRCIGRSLSGS